MNRDNLDYDRARDAARRRAIELRRAAADAFWLGCADAARSALRLAVRLAQHQRLRHAGLEG